MRKVPYEPPKCTVCGSLATAFARNKEPRCTRHQRDAPKTRACPKCGGLMRVRENKKSHNYFWGCASFPACTHTENM